MTDLICEVEARRFSKLFLHELNWGAPDHPPLKIDLGDGESATATNISSYRGLRVWEVPGVLGSAVEAKVDQLISKNTTNRLIIFHRGDVQAWRWPSRTNRGAGVSSRPARHIHRLGADDPAFSSKLDAIRLPDDRVVDVNEVLQKVRAAFDVETKNETRRASKLMARMYTAVEKAYPDDADPATRDHEISVSLARILFLLFGDDTDMWTPDLFLDFMKHETVASGSDVAERLNDLFLALATPTTSRSNADASLRKFPYVNGGIFEEPVKLPPLDTEFRNAVLDACAVDWSTISPAIFGSMFQSVRDAQTRRELGEHYTSEENILRTLNPLFLDELREKYEAAIKRDTDQKQTNSLRALWNSIGEIRYVDPACGCGNFIIVAYRELRALELDIMSALKDLKGDAQLSFDPKSELKIQLDHFYGIEIDEWPARIAETAMYLVDRQCDLRLKERFGDAPERLPIERQAHIVVGNALRIDWSSLLDPSSSVVCAGNPPFHGPKERSASQTSDLRYVWGNSYDGFLDYVSGWYAKALHFLGGCRARWGFVSTNSISQGQAVPTLWGAVFAAGWRIRFAHRTFPWKSEAVGAAAVHCVIVGFDREAGQSATLFDYRSGRPVEKAGVSAPQLNAYLVDGPSVLVRKRMHPISNGLPEVQAGSKAVDWGFLTVEPNEYKEVAADPIAAEYIRPYRGGDELINGEPRWCLWFVGAKLEELTESSLLRARIDEVRSRRLASTKAATRKGAGTPHLFEERRQPTVEYLGIPQTFTETRSHATVARLDPHVIASIKLFTSPDPDGFLFSVISSSMFMTWQKTVGGRLKSDPSFTNTIVWNTLPLPTISDVVRAEIIEAGKAVLSARQHTPDMPLGQQYDPEFMGLPLVNAHKALDELVCLAFGAAGSLEIERDRQRLLFERYEEYVS